MLWLQAVLSLNVRTSSYLLTAMMLGVVLTSYASTKLIARTGSYRGHPVASMALFALTRLLCVVADASPVLATVFLLLYGIAGGLYPQALTLAARNAAGRDDIHGQADGHRAGHLLRRPRDQPAPGPAWPGRLRRRAAPGLPRRHPDCADRAGPVPVPPRHQAVRS
ncbi:hypothetical protein ACWCOT_37660 [Nonomuraea bangladeshensis]